MDYWLKPILMVAWVLAFIAGLGWIMAPLGVRLLLPKYLHGLEALQVLIVGMCFAAVINITRNVFVAVNKQLQIIPVFLCCTGLGAAVSYVLVQMGWGITGVAVGSSTGFLCHATVMIFLALRIHGRARQLTGSIIIKVFGPTCILIVLMVCMEAIFPNPVDLLGEAINTAGKFAVYMAICLPIIGVVESRQHLLKKLTGRQSIPA